MTVDAALFNRLEEFYDAVPRPAADVEDLGPFTLFVSRGGWPYYARPVLGGSGRATVEDVRAVMQRQRELKAPQDFEWVDEVSPGLADVVESAGLVVERCPLLVLQGRPLFSAGSAGLVDPADEDRVVTTRAAIAVGFEHGGTAAGPAGLAARDGARSGKHAAISPAFRDALVAGRVVLGAVYAAEAPEAGPVGGGSLMPVGTVAEIAGVGVLPAFRRRSLAAQLTHLLASEGHRRGVSTVFCSAQSADVARVYSSVGFRRVGTACIAGPGSH